MKRVFAVTINFNKNDLTMQWLESMEKIKKSDFSLNLVIVDNASREPFSLTEKEKKENIHIIISNDNTGFTGGNNIGIQFSLDQGADYILIINNDTIVDENLVKNLLDVLEKNPEIGLVAPKIYFAKGHEFHKDRYKKEDLGKVFWYAGGYIDWGNVRSVHRGVDEVDHGQYDTIEKTGFASGCCMLIRKEVLEKVGFFEKRGFMYYEDAILCEEVKRKGYEIWYVPTAVLWHINAASSGGSGNNLQDYFITRNRMLFGMHYAPIRSKIALLRESLRLLFNGREWQRAGIRDYFLKRFGKGSYIK